jgi:hypothetical protein
MPMHSNPPAEPPNDNSHWPAAPILLYGTFGTRNSAGRRYHRRCSVALAAVLVWMLCAALLRSVVPKGILEAITAIVPGAGFIYAAVEFRKYLSALDELARRIQLESIAWTYLCGLGGAMLLGGIGSVYGWSLSPFWFIVLEPVRAGWLYFVSRRY